MAASEDTSFARLVSLACHDLRTPLATAHGFARTLERIGGLEPPTDRYIQMISAASMQLGDVIDLLAVAARIESGSWEPELREVGTADLARAAAERIGEKASARGDGASVLVEPELAGTAVYSFAYCALRHGGLANVELEVRGPEIAIAPIVPAAAPIVLGEELRDLGAAVAMRVVPALGGSVELDGETLLVRLPLAGG